MKKKKAILGVDFADSEYKTLNMSEDGVLTVFLKSWNSKILQIKFIDTIQFSYKLESTTKQLYEITEESTFLKEALIQDFGYLPTHHSYKLFHLEDIDDFPFLQVVAESVTVIKDGDDKT